MRLQATGIKVSKLFAVDTERERIIKEYIEGSTVYDLVKRDENVEEYIEQVRKMAALAQNAGFNLDYMSTNFIVRNGEICYIDYECNEYTEEFNFENWGIKYWSRSPEFIENLSNVNKMFRSNILRLRARRQESYRPND